jgi:hypothetical protein
LSYAIRHSHVQAQISPLILSQYCLLSISAGEKT